MMLHTFIPISKQERTHESDGLGYGTLALRTVSARSNSARAGAGLHQWRLSCSIRAGTRLFSLCSPVQDGDGIQRCQASDPIAVEIDGSGRLLVRHGDEDAQRRGEG